MFKKIILFLSFSSFLLSEENVPNVFQESILEDCESFENNLDLEDNASPFVLENFQIEIPNYPYAFNPSIVEWKHRYLLSFRVILNDKIPFNSKIGLVWLDENFQPISEPQLLDTQIKNPLVPSRAEDGRLIKIGEKLHVVYSNCIEEKISRGAFRVYVAEICFDGENFHLKDPNPLLYFEGESPGKREKNWVPFEYEENLFLAYSISPHLVFYPLQEFSCCKTISSSPHWLQWPFGDLRGGTGALLEGDEYLSFFHSSKKMRSIHSKDEESLHYFMGAYRFEKHPPFAITQISAAPIIAKGFYSGASYKPYWAPVQAIFPCGFISNENSIWIAYGRQDHECWIVKLDKKGLMESLVPVQK